MQVQNVISFLHQEMLDMYLDLLDHNMELYQDMFQPNVKKIQNKKRMKYSYLYCYCFCMCFINNWIRFCTIIIIN